MFQLRGTYPHRNYPKLFDDPAVGKIAKETFDEAQKMLSQWIKKDTVEARGAIGVFICKQIGEELEPEEEEEPPAPATRAEFIGPMMMV